MKINDGELSLATVNSFVAISESSKVVGSSLTWLIFLGPSPTCTSSSWPVPSEGSCCRRRSGIHKHSLSLVQNRNQTLKVLVSWHSTLLNCSCWALWLLILLPPFFSHTSRMLCPAHHVRQAALFAFSLHWESVALFLFLWSPAAFSCLNWDAHLSSAAASTWHEEELLPPSFLPLLSSPPPFLHSPMCFMSAHCSLSHNITSHCRTAEGPFPSNP